MTPDPIKLAGGLNGYCYVDGNPVGWIDPLGLFSIKNKFPDETMPVDGVRLPYTIENGKIKGIEGRRELDFVVTQDGRLEIGKKHHLLGNAEDVLAAGQFRLNGQGQVRRLENLSGHYRPTPEEALRFPEILQGAGLDLNNTTINIYKFEFTLEGLIKSYEKVGTKVLKNE